MAYSPEKITDMAKALFKEERSINRLDGWFFTKEIQIKYENEANTFAAELLIPDELILEHPYMTKNQIARLAGYDKGIMEFKRI